jgi:hypothetical protein
MVKLGMALVAAPRMESSLALDVAYRRWPFLDEKAAAVNRQRRQRRGDVSRVAAVASEVSEPAKSPRVTATSLKDVSALFSGQPPQKSALQRAPRARFWAAIRVPVGRWR